MNVAKERSVTKSPAGSSDGWEAKTIAHPRAELSRAGVACAAAGRMLLGAHRCQGLGLGLMPCTFLLTPTMDGSRRWAQVLGSMPPTWETKREFLTPDSDLAQSLLWAMGEGSSR